LTNRADIIKHLFSFDLDFGLRERESALPSVSRVGEGGGVVFQSVMQVADADNAMTAQNPCKKRVDRKGREKNPFGYVSEQSVV
jgi:hypothetical protein